MRIVRGIEEFGRDRWAAFVMEHPRGTVFQSPEMYDVYNYTQNYLPITLFAEEKGSIKGVLLAVIMTNGSKVMKALTARSVIIGGPIAVDDDVEVIEQLMEEYKNNLPKFVVYSEIRPVYDLGDFSELFEKKGFCRQGHYNVLVPLKKSKDELYTKVRKERKRHIAQAERAGLVFSEVNDQECIDRIVSLIVETYHRKHVPLSHTSLFYNAAKYLSRYVRFFAIFNGSDIIAGQVALCYNSLVYAWYTGSDETNLHLRPNDMLMWYFIQWANSNGYELFDFGGGGEPGVPYGVRDYKLTFGAELFDYGRYLCVHKPWIYSLGKKGVELLGKKG